MINTLFDTILVVLVLVSVIAFAYAAGQSTERSWFLSSAAWCSSPWAFLPLATLGFAMIGHFMGWSGPTGECCVNGPSVNILSPMYWVMTWMNILIGFWAGKRWQERKHRDNQG